MVIWTSQGKTLKKDNKMNKIDLTEDEILFLFRTLRGDWPTDSDFEDGQGKQHDKLYYKFYDKVRELNIKNIPLDKGSFYAWTSREELLGDK